jgi:hypothetical protein
VIAILVVAGALLVARLVPLSRLIPEGDALDLPCPWCRAPTAEADDICPNCGKRFGDR